MEKVILKNQTKYRESIYKNGRKQHSPTFARKTDAKKWKNQKLIEKDLHKLYGDEVNAHLDISFQSFVQIWIEEITQSPRAERTIEGYLSNLRCHIIPFFESTKLAEIKDQHIREFNTHLKSKGNNGKGRNNIIGVLKTLFKSAYRQRYILRNPCEFIPKEKEDLKKDKFLSMTQTEKLLLTSSNDKYYPLYFLAIHTGMRLGELCGLCWDRVDFENQQIRVSRTRDKKGLRDRTKGGRARIIPLQRDAINLLLSLKGNMSQSEYVLKLPNGDPIPYGHLYREFKKAQKRAGITDDLSLHDLRHTFASHFLMNGGSIFVLKEILGHSDIETTQRYAHLSSDHLQEAVRFMKMTTKDYNFRPDLDQQKSHLSLVASNL